MRILAVDLAGIFHRKWHASSNEKVDHSQRWTMDHIRRIAGQYDSVVIACEGHGPGWRREKFNGYKANRPERDENLTEQLRQTEEACDREGWHTVGRSGMEADDIVATVAAHFDGAHDVDILSDDKDLLQCISGTVRVLRGERAEPRGAADVLAKFGVMPGEFTQFQALMGDSADNIPGVRGVGPKTAAKLLLEFGNLANIIGEAHRDPTGSMTPKERDAWREENPNAVCGKLAENLKLSVSSGELGLSLALVTLKTDALTPKECEALLEPKAIETETAEDFVEGDIMDRESITEQLEAAEVEVVPEPTPSAPEPSQPRAMVPAGNFRQALEPRDMVEAKQFAKYVMDSRMFSTFGTPQAVLLVAMAGREFGLGGMSSLRAFHIVEGKPTPSAQFLMSRCLEHPDCEYFMVLPGDAKTARVEVKRRSWPKAQTWTYTIEQAREAGLLGKNNWKKHPAEMLVNRCIAIASRFTFPDAGLAGMYTADELGSDNYEEAA